MKTSLNPLFTMAGPAESFGLQLSSDGRYALVAHMRFDEEDRYYLDWTRFDLHARTSSLTAVRDDILRASQPSLDGRSLRGFDDRGDRPVLCEVDFESLAVRERLPWTDLGDIAPDDSALIARPDSGELVCFERSGEVRWRQRDESYKAWVKSWWLSRACLVVASEWKGRKLSVLDAATGSVLLRQPCQKTPEGFSLSPAGDRLVGGKRFYLDVLSGEPLPRKLLSKISGFAFSPDGVFLAAASESGAILLLADDAQRLVTRFDAGGEKPGLAWSADGQRLVSLSTVTGQLAVWDVAALLPGVTVGTAPASTIEARVRASAGKAAKPAASATRASVKKASVKKASVKKASASKASARKTSATSTKAKRRGATAPRRSSP